MDDATLFGWALKELRAERGLSQHELADKAGLSRTTIGFIEIGRNCPTLGTMTCLADGLDMKVSEMLALFERNKDEAR